MVNKKEKMIIEDFILPYIEAYINNDNAETLKELFKAKSLLREIVYGKYMDKESPKKWVARKRKEFLTVHERELEIIGRDAYIEGLTGKPSKFKKETEATE